MEFLMMVSRTGLIQKHRIGAIFEEYFLEMRYSMRMRELQIKVLVQPCFSFSYKWHMMSLLHFPFYSDPEASLESSSFVLPTAFTFNSHSQAVSLAHLKRIPRLFPPSVAKGSFIEHWAALCSARERQTSKALLAFIRLDPTRRNRKDTMEWQRRKRKSSFWCY